MSFRLPKGVSGLFKKKDGGKGGDTGYDNKDFGLEEDWDQLDEGRFEEKDDRIVMEEEEPGNKPKRLKGKLIFGIAGVVLTFLLFSVLSNALAPKKVEENKEEAQLSKGSRVTNPAASVPGNYADMAKYQRELEARKQAEESLKNKTVVSDQKPQQPVYTPPQNVAPPSAPSVPSAPGGVSAPSIGMENPYNSPLSFKMDGAGQQQANAAVSNYSPSTSRGSKVDMNSVFTLQAGTVIPATLLNGIDSRLTGDVVAQVRQDVFDSLTGRNLVLPQGSRLLGKLAKGKGRRVGVTFTRIILPDGSSVNLPEQNAVDNAGYPGMKDKYDTHDADFWRGSFVGLVTAVLADGIDEAMDNKNRYVSNGSSNSNEYIRSNVGDYMDKLADRLTERASKTEEPNVRIRPGYQFNVFINQDFNVYGYRRR